MAKQVGRTAEGPWGTLFVCPGSSSHAGNAAGMLIGAGEVQHFSAGAAGTPAHIPGTCNLPGSSDVDGQALLLPAGALRVRIQAAAPE